MLSLILCYVNHYYYYCTIVPVSEQFSIQHRDARQLQYALIYVLGACYLLSGLLYLVSYYQMRNGRKVKA